AGSAHAVAEARLERRRIDHVGEAVAVAQAVQVQPVCLPHIRQRVRNDSLAAATACRRRAFCRWRVFSRRRGASPPRLCAGSVSWAVPSWGLRSVLSPPAWRRAAVHNPSARTAGTLVRPPTRTKGWLARIRPILARFGRGVKEKCVRIRRTTLARTAPLFVR